MVIIYGPKYLWAEMVMGRYGHGPKWLWDEMTSYRSKCKLSKYCSLQCQRENWKEQKFACSVVAGQRLCK